MSPERSASSHFIGPMPSMRRSFSVVKGRKGSSRTLSAAVMRRLLKRMVLTR